MKHKVGDYLIITDWKCGHRFEIGEVVQVTKVSTHGYEARSTTRRGHEWSLAPFEVRPSVPATGTNRIYAEMVLEN